MFLFLVARLAMELAFEILYRYITFLCKIVQVCLKNLCLTSKSVLSYLIYVSRMQSITFTYAAFLSQQFTDWKLFSGYGIDKF